MRAQIETQIWTGLPLHTRRSVVCRLSQMLLTSDEGVIQDIALFAANVDERDALVDMDLSRVKGMLLGDKGFIRPILKEDLAGQGIDLATRRCAATWRRCARAVSCVGRWARVAWWRRS